MKNKIIAVFVACCMVSGAFSLNTANNYNNINTHAVESSEREVKRGYLTMSTYSYIPSVYVEYLDNLNSDGCRYLGDSTSNIDWSKTTGVSVQGSGVSVTGEGRYMQINPGFSDWAIHYAVITISFEDMDFVIDVTTQRISTMPSTTTTTRTTEVTTTPYFFFPATTTTEKKHETMTGELILRAPSSVDFMHKKIKISELDSITGYSYYYGDSTADVDWSKYNNITVVSEGGFLAEWDDKEQDIVITFDIYKSIYGDITVSFDDMDFIISVRFEGVLTTMATTTTKTTTTTTRTTAVTTPWLTAEYPTTTKPSNSTITTPVQDFMIIPSSVSMETGDTNRLLSVGAENLSDIAWTSEDTSIATVSDDGTVTAKGTGSTLIYAVYKGNIASCTINVKAGKGVVYGDANEDGKVNVADAAAIIQHIGNQDDFGLSPQGLANADTDGDGQVMGSDAIIIQRIASGELKLTDLPYKE